MRKLYLLIILLAVFCMGFSGNWGEGGSGSNGVTASAAESISGVWEIQDDILFNFGNDADFGVRYDETTDDRLEVVSNSGTDTEINIANAGAGVTNFGIDGKVSVGASTGIDITGSNGTVTITGLGDGYDETVTLDLNTTDNTVLVGGTAGAWNFQTASMLTSGTIQGATNIISDADGITLTAAQMNSALIMTGAGEVTLADVCDSATGAWELVFIRDASEQIEVVSADSSDTFILADGTALDAGDEADMAVTASSFACFVCLEANKWYVMGERGTVTDGGVAD